MRNVFFILFCLMGSVSAELRPEPGRFAVAGEFLLWRPSLEQPYFVISSSDPLTNHGERVANRQAWHTGYRLEALYRFCNRPTEARVRWTHMPRFNDSKTVSDGFLEALYTTPDPTLAGTPGVADLRDDFNVFYLDVLLGQTIVDYCAFRFTFQAGVQYGYVHLVEQVQFNTPNGSTEMRNVVNKSGIVGLGPELGIDFSYDLFRWLHLTGRASTAVLATQREVSFFDDGTVINPPGVATDVTNTAYWILVPTTNIRLGLSFRAPCDLRRWFDCSPFAGLSCLNFDLEVGYEVMSFYHAVDRLFFTDDVSVGSSTDEIMNVTFHGPYVHLGISF